MCPGLHYNDALTRVNLVSLNEHHRKLCNALFNDILNDKNHRLRYLLPPLRKPAGYSLRHTRTFDVPKVKTNQARNTYIISSSLSFDVI